MIRKTVLSTLAAAILATSVVSLSSNAAMAGNRNRDIAIAVGIGVLAGVLGAKASRHRSHQNNNNNASEQYTYKNRYNNNNVRQTSGGYHIDSHDDNECFQKPIRGWVNGRDAIFGYRTICR